MLRNFQIKALVFVLSTFVVNSASHAEGQTSAKVETPNVSRNGAWTGFLGLGAGLTATEGNDPAEGLPVSAKLLGSYLTESSNYVFDLGLGVNNQQNTNSSARDGATSGTVLEAAARYQIPSLWQFGLVGNSFYNQGAAYQAHQGDAHFLGAQVLKEFSLAPKWIGRLGARAMTLTNVKDDSATMLMVDFQIGWGGNSETQVTETQKQESASISQNNKNTNLVANRNGKTPIVKFEVGDATLKSSDKMYLRELAKVLKINSDMYGKIRVKGYADISGTDSINKKVSKERAHNAASILKELNKNKVEAMGMGINKNSKQVFADDRKIEIELLDVKNPDAMESAIKTIK